MESEIRTGAGYHRSSGETRGRRVSSDHRANGLALQVDHTERRGQVSQSGQFAPFNAGWYMSNIPGVDYGTNDDEVTPKSPI